ncbi:MAG TPA: phosphate ABC transporter permease PstA [Streptosporangiales bacterium]
MSVTSASLRQSRVLARPSTGRRVRNRIATVAVYAAVVVALAPLVAVLFAVVRKGIARLDRTFLTHSMRNIGATDAGGGAYHAIVGTVEQVVLAGLMAIPLGVLVAIYLVEYGGSGRLARAVSFVVDVMTGIPSIVAGLFVLAFWVLALGMGFSGFAGSMALAILMLPVVVRSAEEMFRLVPDELREGALALGVPRWRVILRVVLPTAAAGLVTGLMLAIARVTGETAPLLLTVFFTDSINNDPFHGPQVGIAQFVFDQATRPTDAAVTRAWAGALTLVLGVLVLNLAARALARWKAPKVEAH